MDTNSTYTLEETKAKTGISQPNSPNNKVYYQAYLGKGLFDKKMIDNIVKYENDKEWLQRQVELFVEYLNKIMDISYNKIAKSIRYHTYLVSNLRLPYHICVKILVKYRYYTYGFDRYYKDGK